MHVVHVFRVYSDGDGYFQEQLVGTYFTIADALRDYPRPIRNGRRAGEYPWEYEYRIPNQGLGPEWRSEGYIKGEVYVTYGDVVRGEHP